MSDEATSHNNEECAFCIRFINGDNYVRGEFTGFIPLIRITGKVSNTAIKQTLEKLGLDIAIIKGQSYVGYSSISSRNAVGV